MARPAQTADLTDIQREMLSTVRSFVDREIIPVAQELEHADVYPREIARGWMSVSGVINTHCIVAYVILRHGTREQKNRLLPRMATGEGVRDRTPHAGGTVPAHRRGTSEIQKTLISRGLLETYAIERWSAQGGR